MKKLNRTTAGINSNRPVKVVQFGTGNFLRGFADWILDILNEKAAFNGAVHMLQTHGKSLPDSFLEQDCLYHVWSRGISEGKVVDSIRLVSSVSGLSNPHLDYTGFLELAANPDLEWIVSNTTEAGIQFDPLDSNPDHCPVSFPGKLAAFLYARFLHFAGAEDKGLLVLPCELIEDNGAILQSMVLQYADLWQLTPKFKTWLLNSCTFCNTLVDRIVPGFPKENRSTLESMTGFEDNWAVVAEPYHFWAIKGPRSLEQIFQVSVTGLNIQIVPDLRPYRIRKVRILNGAHTAMVPVAYLKGFRTVREAVEDPEFGNIVRETIFGEIIQTLDLPKDDLEKYATTVLDRFRNPFIRHELISIALNSVSKFKVRVLGSLLEYKTRNGTWPQHLTRSMAGMIRFYSGKYKGESIPLKDSSQVLEFFDAAWQEGDLGRIVNATLANIDFWDQDLNQYDGLYEAVAGELRLFDTE